MDFIPTHMAGLPRRYPTDIPINNIGWVPQKQSPLSRSFRSCNFSFILGGGGFYKDGDTHYPIKAPYVITQWPNRPVAYGPGKNSRGEAYATWDELFLIYSANLSERLTARGFYDPNRPAWPIHQWPLVKRRLDELSTLLKQAHEPSVVDKIDRVCELLIIDSQAPTRRAPEGKVDMALKAIHDYITEYYAQDINVHELALMHGLERSTFRRHWQTKYDVPPARTIQRLRIQDACQRLVHSDEGIGSIALSLNYQDPLYFSRRFKAEMGMSPRAYRKLYHAP